MIPVIGIGICFAIAAVYSKLELHAGSFFAQTMINVVVITAFCAVLQASLVSKNGPRTIKISKKKNSKKFQKQKKIILNN